MSHRRPLRGEIQCAVEDSAAGKMLVGKIKDGDSVAVTNENGRIEAARS